jgi:hypothetical protein
MRSDVSSLSREFVTAADSILPTTYHTPAGDRVNNVEGLCIVLRRLIFPARWYDLVSDFNPSRFQNRLQEWAAAIAAHSAGIDPLLHIVLFIDGTLRGTTRRIRPIFLLG